MFFFFFNDTATTEIYTLSLHDALPIFDAAATDPTAPAPSSSAQNPSCSREIATGSGSARQPQARQPCRSSARGDRKSTRLNSSHLVISYAVFCLKKKNKKTSIEANIGA